MYQKGRAWIEINQKYLAWNVEQLKNVLPKGCALMPAVKANAYGHGAELVSPLLQSMGIRNFCVASVQEGIELRNAGITGQILVLGYTHPSSFADLSQNELTQTVVDYQYARELNRHNKPLEVHVGIDTGMHRLGERCDNMENIRKVWSLSNLKITGLFSHLCVSDGRSEEERGFTWKQLERFQTVVDSLHRVGICGFTTHIQGSYGILNYPGLQFDYARAGIALYGALSTKQDTTVVEVELKPVLSLKARIECIKTLHTGESAGYGLDYTAATERRIAVVSIGYADGIPRALSNNGHALLCGFKVPVVGRICMDQLLLDVTKAARVRPGEEAVFIGKSGEYELSAGDLAASAGTISNEILSRLGQRLERVTR